ncbi:MAG: site-specific integrase [Acidobacteriota bacterium]|nr:site-specific integrase [Acidobacteriota bacterium]
MLRVICAHPLGGTRLGTMPVTDVTEHNVELFLQGLAAAGRAPSTRNHYLRLAKLLGRWMVRQGYRPTPIIGADSELGQDKETPRNRRLHTGEEERLLKAAKTEMQSLIIAALETCARRGELLGVQWQEVDLQRHRMRLLARNTKNGKERVIPISTRLLAVLEMATVGPNGVQHGPEDFVFGDATGRRIASPKTAWRATCRRAGITGLRFHDLRHEAGSRLVEAGWPLHYVQAMLGHSNLKQTSIYLNVPLGGLEQAMRKYDQQRAACNPVASSAVADPRPDCNTTAAPAGNPPIH